MGHALRRIVLGTLGAGMAAAMAVGATAGTAFAAPVSSPAHAASVARPQAALKWPVVRAGARGPQVVTIQHLLNAQINAHLATDGIFGSKTTAAVKSFQKKNGLVADGVVGQKTWPKLIMTVTLGSSGSAVRAVQRQLHNVYGFKTLKVDGRFGLATAAAVRTFQKRYKIFTDAIVGPVTWNTLVVKD
jgi:peptidoglycan hydrolase-like protein with peptidoglycan-binding domain